MTPATAPRLDCGGWTPTTSLWGTGSAGSVVANRLECDPSAAVVVLEAGPKDKRQIHPHTQGLRQANRAPMDWDYLTEPQKELDGRARSIGREAECSAVRHR